MISWKEAAKIAGVNKNTTKNWYKRGYIKGAKVKQREDRNTYIFDKNSLLNYLDEYRMKKTEKQNKYERLENKPWKIRMILTIIAYLLEAILPKEYIEENFGLYSAIEHWKKLTKD